MPPLVSLCYRIKGAFFGCGIISVIYVGLGVPIVHKQYAANIYLVFDVRLNAHIVGINFYDYIAVVGAVIFIDSYTVN